MPPFVNLSYAKNADPQYLPDAKFGRCSSNSS